MAKSKIKATKGNARRAVSKKTAVEDDAFLRTQRIIARQVKKNPADVKLESSLQADLGADSLDALEIVFQLEEEFSIKILEQEANKIVTVQDIVTFVREKIKK